MTKTEAFIASLAETKTNDCIIWPFARFIRGYGRMEVRGKVFYAHRVICERYNGHAPTPNHECAHSCNNGEGGCVNWRHLRWATHRENMHDKFAFGTNTNGEKHGNAKLTDDAVFEIRRSSLAPSVLAAQFGVAPKTVRDVINRATWNHL